MVRDSQCAETTHTHRHIRAQGTSTRHGTMTHHSHSGPQGPGCGPVGVDRRDLTSEEGTGDIQILGVPSQLEGERDEKLEDGRGTVGVVSDCAAPTNYVEQERTDCFDGKTQGPLWQVPKEFSEGSRLEKSHELELKGE